MKLYRTLAALALAFAAGCTDDAPSAPSPDDAFTLEANAAAPGRPHIVALTRNLYIGADLDRVIGALASPDPADDVPALLEAVQTLQVTDFPTRARAIADEIARLRPHVVGLQEVSQIDVDLTALGVPLQIDLDYLAILQAALAARGLDYRVAASVRNVDASPLPFIRLVDSDVILVDAPRASAGTDAIGSTYQANIGPVAPGVSIIRGFTAVTVRVGEVPVRVANTHLESGSSPLVAGLRAAQAAELAAALGTAERVLLLGDFNDELGSGMYQVLLGAGFRDVWAVLRPERLSSGATCCHAADLSNPVQTLTQRIDYVFERGLEHRQAGLLGTIVRTGFERRERIAGPLFSIWPSDHAGVAAMLVLPRERERGR